MKKIMFTTLLLFCGITFMGCFKNAIEYDYSGKQPAIIIPDANWPGSMMPLQDSLLMTPAASAVLKLYARVSWGTTLGEDLRVRFAQAPHEINNYNTKWFKNYSQLPDSCYQVNAWELTIPKDNRDAYLPITIYPSKIKQGVYYMLSFEITDAAGKQIGANLKSKLFSILRP